MKLWESPLRSLRAASVLTGALSVVVFLNALANGWAFDDYHILLGNPALQSLETLPAALGAPYWPGESGMGLGLWRPAITAVYGAGWALWGPNPVPFHLLNVLLHAGVTVLVVQLLGSFLPVSAAFVAGLFFAVHPIHVEAVANVVGMAELLSAFFFLAACLVVSRRGARLSPPFLLLVLFLYALAFLTKESAAVLPLVILLLDGSREDLRLRGLRRYLGQRGALYGGLALVAAVILLARTQVLGSVASPFAPLGAHLLEEVPRIWTVAGTWPQLFRLLFFPADLAADYSPAVIPLALGWNAGNLLGVALALGGLFLALFSWRRGPLMPHRLGDRALGWGILWFVLTLLPTSNLFFLSGILLSERTLYLPSVGFVAALSWMLLRLASERPRWALGLMVLGLALLGWKTWDRTPTWKDNAAVFGTLAEEHPESGRAQWLMGDLYLQAGRVSEALRAYRVAIGLIGNHHGFLVEVGRNLLLARQEAAAEGVLSFAWREWPQYGVAPALLAVLYDRQGRAPEAEAAARAALRSDTTRAAQAHILSRALQAQGRLEEAREARWSVLRLGEGERWEQWGWLAELELLRGDTAAAFRAADSARARGRSPGAARRVDSLLTELGLPPRASESARISQNPRPGEGGSF